MPQISNRAVYGHVLSFLFIFQAKGNHIFILPALFGGRLALLPADLAPYVFVP
jgi:hypothetical protein